jgi:hypothetical protein
VRHRSASGLQPMPFRTRPRLALVLAALVLLPSSASANNYFGWHANNDYNDVGFAKCDLNAGSSNAFDANDSHDVEPTDVTTTIYVSCSGGSTDDHIDVRVNDSDYGANGKNGWAECHYLNTADVCDDAHAHLNLHYGPYNSDEWMHLVCHEVGHTVGLAHAGSGLSCMRSGVWTNLHLVQHDKDIVNSLYP